MMSISDLLPNLQALPRPEKLEVIRLLVAQLAEEEKILSLVQPGASYPAFSPHDASEAAAAMLDYLEKHKSKS